MYYILEHGGLLLAEVGDWSQIWFGEEGKALKIWDKTKAEQLRERFGGRLLPRIALS